MKVIRSVVVCWVLVVSIFWSFGCSLIQHITPQEKPPPAPVPYAVETLPEDLPEDVAPPSTPEVKYFTHKIKWPGENLIRISRWYTGTGKNWLRIVEANPSIDPRRIRIGDAILIPEMLLMTREPMPISYLAPAAKRKKEPPVPSAESLPNTGEVELFGPIDTEMQTGRIGGTGSPLPLETIE